AMSPFVETWPFSFIYGGRPSADLLKSWTITRTQERAAAGTKRAVIRARDPKTGLEIACEVTTFDRFPAVDWVLRITNKGTQDTPILEDIRVLDHTFTRSASDGREFILRHSRGSRADVTDFAPTDDLLE